MDGRSEDACIHATASEFASVRAEVSVLGGVRHLAKEVKLELESASAEAESLVRHSDGRLLLVKRAARCPTSAPRENLRQ